MTATTITLGPMSEVEHQSALRRAVIASTVGTTIEWYDFLIYSTVTGLVFNKVYFPGSDPWVGTLQAFGVYFVGFVARPIGAVIFGHYGDRIGRKATLIVTLLMTGIATAAVGLVPGYASIGIWGAVILTVLRLIQGIGVGGEWGGSVLLAMEWAQTNKNRGFITSWPQFGAPAGLFLANVAVLFFSWYSGDQFLNWGWRIPFLMSIIMVAEQTPGYIFNAFVLTYGTLVVGASRDLLLTGLVAMTALGFITAPLAGALSDRIGRRKVYIFGCVLVAAFTFVYFAMLDTKVPGLIFLAVALSFIPVMIMYGPEAALIAEAFTPRLRYSGASIGYQLASIIAGGPAPFVSTWLFSTYHSAFPIGLYVCVCAAISICAALLLPDQTNKDIAHEVNYGNA
jgi:MFS family permease